MKWQQLLNGVFGRISEMLEAALSGLTADDLNQQPHPDCNSMGWLTWHLTRVQDRVIADLSGGEQLWIKDGWYQRFNRPADPTDIGVGHRPEDVAAFKSPDVATLLEYHHAVLERTKRYISRLTAAELRRKIDHPRYPTVGARLPGIIDDNAQHAGQVAYLRGFYKGRGWYPR